MSTSQFGKPLLCFLRCPSHPPVRARRVFYDRERATARFTWQAATGRPITVWTTAWKQKRPYLYLGDCVQAINFLVERKLFNGETYNVGSGEACSTQQLLDILCELMGVRPRIRWSGANRPGDPQRFLANIDRLQALGWRPTVSLREGVRRTLAWYREEMSSVSDREPW